MKMLTGKVVSIKTSKSAVVLILRQQFHPLYKKIMKKTKRLLVHLEDDTIREGDRVKILSIRPMSKRKHYKIVGKANV